MMVPKNIRIRLENEKYLTRRKGLARSDIWRDLIRIYTASGVGSDWAIIRPKVCIYATDDMGVQLHGLLFLATHTCKDHDHTYIMELDGVSQGRQEQANNDVAIRIKCGHAVPKKRRRQQLN